MNAIVIKGYGSPQLLEYVEIDAPTIQSDEILVEVYATSVNPVDWKIRKGQLSFLTGKKFPRILGGDFAGKVVRIGSSVKDYKTGDEIYGSIDATKGGAYAEYLTVHPETVSYKPQGLSFNQAAAIPMAALTALQSLRDLGHVSTGKKVLINGCSGGVGTFAIQIAKAYNAEVTGVCSYRNIALAKKLGAGKVVDYTKEDVLDLQEKFDVFFDVVANQNFTKVKNLLTKKGIYITTSPSFKTIAQSVFTNFFRQKKIKIVFVRSIPEDLNCIRALIESGKLTPYISKVYPLQYAREAHELSESGRAKGKLVLEVKK